jgi:hypothetical protein
MHLRFTLLALAFAAVLASSLPGRAEEGYGLPLEGAEAEAFLERAKIVSREVLGIGVTRSERVTLSDGESTIDAIWKTIDEYAPMKKFEDGSVEIGFHDSYKNEVAAYGLDKMLGLGMVPPTVQRRIGRDRGSLQIWAMGTTMEFDRMERGELPANPAERNRQIYDMRVFHNLIYDTDLANARNILNDPEGRLYVIDNSRCFRTAHELPTAGDLARFSRSLLERLRALDAGEIKKELGRWLSKKQIEALMARRDLILEIAERRVAEHGEDATLFD